MKKSGDRKDDMRVLITVGLGGLRGLGFLDRGTCSYAYCGLGVEGVLMEVGTVGMYAWKPK